MDNESIAEVVNGSALGGDLRLRRRGLDAAGMTAEFDEVQHLKSKAYDDIEDPALRSKAWEANIGWRANLRESIRQYEVAEVARGAQEQISRNFDDATKKAAEYYTFEAGRLKSEFDAECARAQKAADELSFSRLHSLEAITSSGKEIADEDFAKIDAERKAVEENADAERTAVYERLVAEAKGRYDLGLNKLAGKVMSDFNGAYSSLYNGLMSLNPDEDAAHNAAGLAVSKKTKELGAAMVAAGYTDFASVLFGDSYLGSPNATKVAVMETKKGEDGKDVVVPKLQKVKVKGPDGKDMEVVAPVFDPTSYNPSGRLWMTIGDVADVQNALAHRVAADARARSAANAQAEMERINILSRTSAEIEMMFQPVVAADGKVGDSFNLEKYTQTVNALTAMRNSAQTKGEREIADGYLNKARTLYNQHMSHIEHSAALARSAEARAEAKARRDKADKRRDLREQAFSTKLLMQDEYDRLLSTAARARAEGKELISVPVVGEDGKATEIKMTPDAATRSIIEAGQARGVCLGAKYNTQYNKATLAATAPAFYDKVISELGVYVPDKQYVLAGGERTSYTLESLGANILAGSGKDAKTDMKINVSRRRDGRIATDLYGKRINRVMVPVSGVAEGGDSVTKDMSVSVSAFEDAMNALEEYRAVHPNATATMLRTAFNRSLRHALVNDANDASQEAVGSAVRKMMQTVLPKTGAVVQGSITPYTEHQWTPAMRAIDLNPMEPVSQDDDYDTIADDLISEEQY